MRVAPSNSASGRWLDMSSTKRRQPVPVGVCPPHTIGAVNTRSDTPERLTEIIAVALAELVSLISNAEIGSLIMFSRWAEQWGESSLRVSTCLELAVR